MMIPLRGIVILSLLGLALGEKKYNKQKTWNAGRNALVPPSVIPSDICLEEVPRCPAQAEPRCVQYIQTNTPPAPNNTMWRCILCENTEMDKECFLVVPIEAYTAKDPQMYKRRDKNPQGGQPYAVPPAANNRVYYPQQQPNVGNSQNYPYDTPYTQQSYQPYQPIQSPYGYTRYPSNNIHSTATAYPTGYYYR